MHFLMLLLTLQRIGTTNPPIGFNLSLHEIQYSTSSFLKSDDALRSH